MAGMKVKDFIETMKNIEEELNKEISSINGFSDIQNCPI